MDYKKYVCIRSIENPKSNYLCTAPCFCNIENGDIVVARAKGNEFDGVIYASIDVDAGGEMERFIRDSFRVSETEELPRIIGKRQVYMFE